MTGVDIAIIVIASVLVLAAAAYLIYRKVKKKGACDCGCEECGCCDKCKSATKPRKES